MIKKKKETIEKTVISDVICNQCGNSLKDCSVLKGDEANFCGLVHGEVRGNYDSKVLEDLRSYKFSLCEICLKKMFKGFKIPVDEEEYDAFSSWSD